MKKIIAVLLSALMLLLMLPVGVFATEEDTATAPEATVTDWSAATVELKNVTDVFNFFNAQLKERNFKGQTVKLACDADMRSLTLATRDNSYQAFAGIFDGQGHVITALTVKIGAGNGGLFGNSDPEESPTIQNVIFLDCTIDGAWQPGFFYGGSGLADYARAINIKNVYVKNLTHKTASAYGGGLVGFGQVVAENVVVTSNLQTATGNNGGNNRFGGMVGKALAGSTFTNCAFYGRLSLVNSAGYACEQANYITLNDCISILTADSSSMRPYAYGVMNNVCPTIATGAAALTMTGFGGSKNTGIVGIKDYAAEAYVGSAAQSILTENGMDGWTVTEDDYPLPTAIADMLKNIELSKSPMPADHWYTLELVDETPTLFQIDSAEDMIAFSECLENGLDFSGCTVELVQDVDLNAGWSATANEVTAPTNVWKLVTGGKLFSGTFDGKGNTVSGIYLKTEAASMGFFGNAAGSAVVKDLAIVNSYMESNNLAQGAVFGSIYGNVTVSGVYLDVTVVNTYSTYGTDADCGVGGFVGAMEGGTTVNFENSVFAGHIKTTQGNSEGGAQGVGGFVGLANKLSTVNAKDCGFFGKLECAAYGAAGFVGKIGNFSAPKVTVTAENMIVAGVVSTGDEGWVGSYAGQIISGTLTTTNCYYIKLSNGGYVADHPAFGAVDAYKTYTGCTLVSDMDIRGTDTAAWLTEKGLTAWTATEGYPMPTALSNALPTEVPGKGDVANDNWPEKQAPSTGNDDKTETNAPETNAPTGNTTTAASAEEESGCASVVGGAAVVMIAMAAVVVYKKKED